MENEIYHAKGHKYLKKILGKNGVYRYIYKLTSEKEAAKYQKLQKEAQTKYNSARNEYNKYNEENNKLKESASYAYQQYKKAFKNRDDYGVEANWNEYSRLQSKAFDVGAKAMYAQNEARYQAALIEEYYKAGVKARQDYLDFVKDSESLAKATKGKSFVSNLFSKIFKKKK